MSTPLIVTAPGGKLEVPKSAIETLGRLTRPLRIVAVCGKYRSGKSTLLGRLLGGGNGSTPFTVGHTVNACSKGICCALIPGTDVLLLDTEGLLSPDSSSTHDTRIFALALLLSSTLIYNITSTIDENALSTLRVVCDFASLMVQDGEGGNDGGGLEALARHMPRFDVLVRDFALELVTPSGEPLTTNEWFESVLSTDCFAADVDGAQDKTQIRRTLRELFPRRGCTTLPHPGGDPASPSTTTGANSAFESGIEALRKRIIASEAKQVEGVSVNGAALVALARQLVDKINSGSTPHIRDCWSMLSSLRLRDASTEAVAHMQHVTASWAESDIPLEKLRTALAKVQQEAMMRYVTATANLAPSAEEAAALRADLERQLEARAEEVLRAAERKHRAAVEASERVAMQTLQVSLEQLTEAKTHEELAAAWGHVEAAAVGGAAADVWAHVGACDAAVEPFGKRLADILVEAGRLLVEEAGGSAAQRAKMEALEASVATWQRARDELEEELTRVRNESLAEIQGAGERQREAEEQAAANFEAEKRELTGQLERLKEEFSAAMRDKNALAVARDALATQLEHTAAAEKAAEAGGDESKRIIEEVEVLRLQLQDERLRADAATTDLQQCQEKLTQGTREFEATLEALRRDTEATTKSIREDAEGTVAKAKAGQQAAAKAQQLAQREVDRLMAQLEAQRTQQRQLQEEVERSRREHHEYQIAHQSSIKEAFHDRSEAEQRHRQELSEREEQWKRHFVEQSQRQLENEIQIAKAESTVASHKRLTQDYEQITQEAKRLRVNTNEAQLARTRAEAAQSAATTQLDAKTRLAEQALAENAALKAKITDLERSLSVALYRADLKSQVV